MMTVTYGRPRLLGLPYVVKMFRVILAVLCRNNLLVHVTKRQIHQARPPTGRPRRLELPHLFHCSETITLHGY